MGRLSTRLGKHFFAVDKRVRHGDDDDVHVGLDGDESDYVVG